MNRNEPHEPQRFMSMDRIGTVYECPACGSLLSIGQKRCDMCEQAIDWSKEATNREKNEP